MPEDAARVFLARQSMGRSDERGRYHAYAVEHLAAGRVIGDVGIFLPADPEFEGDVGFQFHPDIHGRGYAHEAMEVLLRHAFEDLGLARVTANCDRENLASLRLMTRLGMKPLPDLEEHSLTCELMRESWSAQRSPR